MKHLQFIDEHGSFSIEQPENTSYLYFPLASEKGLKSSVTPNLGGDANKLSLFSAGVRERPEKFRHSQSRRGRKDRSGNFPP